MIRTVIIDDEAHCIQRLGMLLEDHCKESVHLMDSFLSVEEGISGISKLQPELVFLDVQINGQTGFDLLKKMQPIRFEVIFTTAYEKYAVQAFKFSAIDYLLKPVDADDLLQAVAKANNKMSGNEMSHKLDTLFHNLKNIGEPKKISISTLDGLIFLDITDIVRCQSHINYTTIYLKNNQKITVSKTLKEFEELLGDYNFYRVHNSHLINLACIRKYNRGKGGLVTMADHSEVEVSTRRKEDFLKKLSEI